MKFLDRILATLLAFLLTASPALAQIRPDFIPGPLTVNVADLPTGVADGLVRRLGDGDAEGSLVSFRASDSKWYCTGFFQNFELNASCTPWSIITGPTSVGDQSTKVQEWLDDFKALNDTATLNTRKEPYLQIERGMINLFNPVSYIDDDDLFPDFRLQGRGRGSGFRCDIGEGNNCFTVGSSVGTGNVFELRNLNFAGDNSNADCLLCGVNGWAQADLINVGFGNYANKGLALANNAIHVHIHGGHCGSSDNFFFASATNPACIHVRSHSDVNISDTTFEEAAGSASKGWIVLAEIGSSGGANSLSINGITGSSGWGIIQINSATSAPGTVSIRNIRGTDVKKGIVTSQQSASDFLDIENVRLNLVGTANAGENCLELAGGGAHVEDVHCKGFWNGVEYQFHYAEMHAVLEDTVNHCFRSDNGSGGTTITGTIRGGCGSGNLISQGDNLLGGENVFGPFKLHDAASRDDTFAGTFDAADRFVLSERAQIVTIPCSDEPTCADDSTAGTASDNVWSQVVRLACPDDPNGGDWTIGTGGFGAQAGTQFSVRLIDDGCGGTINVISNTGTEAITTTDIFTYECIAGAGWNRVN